MPALPKATPVRNCYQVASALRDQCRRARHADDQQRGRSGGFLRHAQSETTGWRPIKWSLPRRISSSASPDPDGENERKQHYFPRPSLATASRPQPRLAGTATLSSLGGASFSSRMSAANSSRVLPAIRGFVAPLFADRAHGVTSVVVPRPDKRLVRQREQLVVIDSYRSWRRRFENRCRPVPRTASASPVRGEAERES